MCIRPGTPLSLDDARRLVPGYVTHYNNVHLNSAIGYITPKDMLVGRQQEIHAERDRKLEEAREQRQFRRHNDEHAFRSARVKGIIWPESCWEVLGFDRLSIVEAGEMGEQGRVL